MAWRTRHAPARIATILANKQAKTFPARSRSGESRLRSEPGGGRQRPRPGGALRLEPRVADRVVAILEVRVGNHAGTAGALGDVLAGHLQMHAAAMRSFGAV